MGGMAKKLKELRQMSEDEVMEAHDVEAKSTIVGVDYWLNELQRREQLRDTKTMRNLTWSIFSLTLVITGFTIAIFCITLKGG